jgi:hypothetical protein
MRYVWALENSASSAPYSCSTPTLITRWILDTTGESARSAAQEPKSAPCEAPVFNLGVQWHLACGLLALRFLETAAEFEATDGGVCVKSSPPTPTKLSRSGTRN